MGEGDLSSTRTRHKDGVPTEVIHNNAPLGLESVLAASMQALFTVEPLYPLGQTVSLQ